MLHNRGEYGVTDLQILTGELKSLFVLTLNIDFWGLNPSTVGDISTNWISVIKGAGGARVSPSWPPAPETPSTRGVLPGSWLPAPFWP